MLAEKALSAIGFHINRYPVAGPNFAHPAAHCFHYANHLMPYGNTWNCPRHRAVLDMQIAGANTGQRYPHNGVTLVYYSWLLLLPQLKIARADISIG